MSEHLRVADEDRERVAARLREHFAAGRITQEELDERLQQTYAARTVGDLDALQTDLPALPLSPAEQREALAARRRRLRRRMLQESSGGLTAFVICTFVWAAAGASGAFWPIWVLLITLIPLVRGGLALYGPAPDLDRLEQRRQRRSRRRRDLPR